ncbi:MAG: hypothetical protein KF712_17645 [Akkermansiaceae bacterium]|nr:hypothetical protein [Akkermansiaceae bacterium]
MNLSRTLREILICTILATCMPSSAQPPLAADLPARSDTKTTALFGPAVSGNAKLLPREDPAAFTGRYLTATADYQSVAAGDLPPEGDPLHIWVRYQATALQMKTSIDGKAVEFPWDWTRHPDGFGWRKVGSFERSRLGGSIHFISEVNRTPKSGVDALVITADPTWQPSAAPSAPPTEAVPAENARVVINWNRLSRPVSPYLYSLNCQHGFSATSPRPGWSEGISFMKPRLLRIHNGSLVKTWFDPATGTWNKDKIRAALDSLRPPSGTELLLNINSWPEAYDADKDGRLDPDMVEPYSLLCADLVRIINREFKAGIRYWEITNEKDVAYWRPHERGPAGPPADVPALAKIHNTAAAAMRKVDPDIKLGGPAACHPLPTQQLTEYARLTRRNLDFLSFHIYATGSAEESDRSVYDKTSSMARNTISLIESVRDEVSSSRLEFHLNEFNINYTWEPRDPRMANHKGAVFDALFLIAHSRIPDLTAINAWSDQDGAYGKMNMDGTLRPAAHVFHHFNTRLDGSPAQVASSSEQSVVPFAAVKNGKPAFVLVNRTSVPQSVTVTSNGMDTSTPWISSAIEASGVSADASLLLKSPVVLSPHSVRFIWKD